MVQQASIVFDVARQMVEMSPALMKNLLDELDAMVMDRTLVILDIFAA